MTEIDVFSPDWISPPGDTIADLLDEKGWQRAELADRTGFTRKHVNELIQGRASLTADTAQRLATVLGSTVEFWLAREAQYRAVLQRRESDASLSQDVAWLRELPVAWMVKHKWIRRESKKTAQVAECLKFFGVASVDAWHTTYANPLAAFRASKRFDAHLGAVAAWLRKAELEAGDIACAPYGAERFRDALAQLRSLSTAHEPDTFVPQLQTTCGDCGVAVVLVPAPPGCPVAGATRWLSPNKALVALSLRYKSNDQLWFSFFHEAAHLLKHGKKLLFIEGLDGLDAEIEAEADKFSRVLLIPPTHDGALRQLKAESAVKAFAKRLGVAPGIVVGRLQHDGVIPHSQLNHLKVHYRWDGC